MKEWTEQDERNYEAYCVSMEARIKEEREEHMLMLSKLSTEDWLNFIAEHINHLGEQAWEDARYSDGMELSGAYKELQRLRKSAEK